jgi:exopolysaccharide biosynthesis polyprenyl glycosylphosphotransferase
MKNPFRKVLIVIGMIEICDLIILNIMYVLFYCANLHLFEGKSIIEHTQSYWLIGNITYLISINLICIVLHDRLIRPETIVSKAGRALLLQSILFLAGLSLFWISAPSILMLLSFYIPTFIVISMARLLLHKCFGFIRYTGRDNRNVILVGDGQNMQNIANTMTDRWNGYHLLGTFTDKDINYYPKPIKRLDDISGVIPYISSHRVDELYCGLPSIRRDEIVPIINYCENNLIRFFSVPNLQNYLKRKLSLRQLGSTTVLAISKEPLGILYNRWFKRLFDLAASTLFLCTLYPIIYIIVGSIMKFTSPGPVYFKQLRTGLDGRNFMCLKFRSMKTKFGNFLRQTNLDKLPQLINVWKGDLSFVGPRPHMLEHTEYYSQLINHYMVRHLVKSGITGWSQVSGFRGETRELSDMEGHVKHDIWYLENWTFWLDIYIILKTFVNMIHREVEAY